MAYPGSAKWNTQIGKWFHSHAAIGCLRQEEAAQHRGDGNYGVFWLLLSKRSTASTKSPRSCTIFAAFRCSRVHGLARGPQRVSLDWGNQHDPESRT
jgi:hypothetical protein